MGHPDLHLAVDLDPELPLDDVMAEIDDLRGQDGDVHRRARVQVYSYSDITSPTLDIGTHLAHAGELVDTVLKALHDRLNPKLSGTPTLCRDAHTLASRPAYLKP